MSTERDERFQDLLAQIDKSRLPRHVGVIMDGNRRWARQHKVSRIKGHRQGIISVQEVVYAAGKAGLEHITIYTFSTENWQRSKTEVNSLMRLFTETISKYIDGLHANNVKIDVIGSRQRISTQLLDNFNNVCSRTWNNTGLNLHIALNYGGRQEVVEAINQIIDDMASGRIPKQPVTEELIGSYLYTTKIPDPDLIIRTSGEQRMSNFLLWQSAYSELYFTSVYWPDFDRCCFLEALLDYQNRNRKFGAE
jgi:undecaprenyl diphosphate synthase